MSVMDIYGHSWGCSCVLLKHKVQPLKILHRFSEACFHPEPSNIWEITEQYTFTIFAYFLPEVGYTIFYSLSHNEQLLPIQFHLQETWCVDTVYSCWRLISWHMIRLLYRSSNSAFFSKVVTPSSSLAQTLLMYTALRFGHVWACMSATDWKMVLAYFQVAVVLKYLAGSKRIQLPVLVKTECTDALLLHFVIDSLTWLCG